MNLTVELKTFGGVEFKVVEVDGIGYFNHAQLQDISDRIVTEQAQYTYVDIAEAQKYLDGHADVYAEMKQWSPEPGIAATVKVER